MRRAAARHARPVAAGSPAAHAWRLEPRAGRHLTALATALGLLAAMLVAFTPRDARAQEVCVLAPVLRDTVVSQGIGTTATSVGYRNLRRGKATVVRAALSKPQCAGSQDRVRVTSATLEVSFPGRADRPVVPNTITGPTFPELLDFTAAPALNAASDPGFTVPGALLDSAITDRVVASFTITVQYEATSALGVPSRGVTTLRPSGALDGPTVTASFEKPSLSPRLLIVPMGDPTKGFAANWPGRSAEGVADGADDVLLRALQAASRVSPFKDGVAQDLRDAAGLRYALAPTVLDVREAIRADGKFCGTGTNFSYVRSQLSSFLNNWQTANSGVVIDKVLGVVWGPNSTGPRTDTACADGYATIGGNQAWSRLEPSATDVAGNAGNLIVMETVGHNFGSVPSTRDATGDAYHSVLTADAGERGVNTATGRTIQNALSVLKYATTGWDDYTTLLRREDYTYTLCRLTPDSLDKCPVEQVDLTKNTTPIGAPAGLAPSVYTIAGTTDGTAAGTDFDTYLSPDTDVSDAVDGAEYRLVQRATAGGPPLSTTGFVVDFRTSEHHDGGPHEHPTSALGSVEVRFAAAPAATVFEVYKGDPATTAPIYRRQRDGAPEPGVGTVAPAPGPLVNQTADLAKGGDRPALSPGGDRLAYTSSSGLVIKDLASGTSGAAVPGDAASWIDGTTLAFVDDGNLYVGSVSRGEKPTVTDRRLVYDASRQVELFFAPAGRPTVQGQHLVTALGQAGNRDLWRIDLREALLSPTGVTCSLAAGSLAPCHRVTSGDPDDHDPAYAGTGRVLFTRTSTLQALDLTTGRLEARAVKGGSRVAVSGEQMAYATSQGLALGDSASFDAINPSLTNGKDSWPSLRGEALAFARTVDGRTDVFTTRLRTNTLTFSATDNAPSRLRAGVYATCDGLDFPIFVDTPPSAFTTTEASWTLQWDGAGATCSDPLLHAVVNDGIDTVLVPLGSGSGPREPRTGQVGAIYAPAPGTTVLQYEAPSLLGDVPGVPTGQLAWRVTGPDHDAAVTFVRGEPTLAFPPAGGWRDGGLYTVRLLHGEEVLASGTFRALADGDHDNIPRRVEERCFGLKADNDPTNAGLDSDGDGDVNVADSDPCTSATNVKVDLDANSLNTGAKGNTVTLFLTGSAVDLRTVPREAIAATRIGGYVADLRAVAVESVTATSAVVKLSRQELQQFVAARGLKGYVPVLLTGTGTAGTFRGLDPHDPRFF